MGGALEVGFLAGIAVVDLRRLDDLQRHLVVRVLHPEGTAAGLAFVLHHAADAHGSVELVVEVVDLLDLVVLAHIVGDGDHQLVLGETHHLVELVGADCSLVEQLEVLEGALLQAEEEAGQHLFIYKGGLGFGLGHDVVDVLDEDDLLGQVVEVLDQGTVSARAEEEAAVGLAEEVALGVDGDGVGGGFLAAVADVVAHAVLLLVAVLELGHGLLEELFVLGRDGEVQLGGAFVVGGVACGLEEVLLEGETVEAVVVVELEQGLGQLAVVEAFVGEQQAHQVDLAVLLQHAVDAEAVVVLRGAVEVVEEGEAVDVGEEDVCELGILAGLHKGEEVLEHARGGA